jgi:hypothetical protein
LVFLKFYLFTITISQGIKSWYSVPLAYSLAILSLIKLLFDTNRFLSLFSFNLQYFKEHNFHFNALVQDYENHRPIKMALEIQHFSYYMFLYLEGQVDIIGF